MLEIIARAIYGAADGAASWEWLQKHHPEDVEMFRNRASAVLQAISDNGYVILKAPYHVYWGPNPSKMDGPSASKEETP
jgi:hypothetical protein